MKKDFTVLIYTIGLNRSRDFDPRFHEALRLANRIYCYPTCMRNILEQSDDIRDRVSNIHPFEPLMLMENIKAEMNSGGNIALVLPDLPNYGKNVIEMLRSVKPEIQAEIRHFSSRGVIEDAIVKFGINAGTSLLLRDVSKVERFESNPIHCDQANLLYCAAGIPGLQKYLKKISRFLPQTKELFGMVWQQDSGWTPEALTLGGFLKLKDFHGFLPLVYIPVTNPVASLDAFAETIARLRTPDGCPWDREQTHISLRTNLLEETYEALAALDAGDMAHLNEELGDVLLQIVLHAQIAQENGEFTLTDVIEGINRKIISRHPHVFGGLDLKDSKSVIQNWEKIKTHERAENGTEQQQGMLKSVPRILPALSLAQKYQERAARVGFDWTEVSPVIEKIQEELGEVQAADSTQEREKELGDLMFAVVNLARWLNVDAESALRVMTLRFKNRFEHIETQAAMQGRSLSDMTLDEMDALWNEAKTRESD